MPGQEVLSVFSTELIRQMFSMLPLYIGEAVFSCLYTAKFLLQKYDTKQLLALWVLPYVILDELLFALVPNIDPLHDPMWITARIFLLTLLQRSLFIQREPGMHSFLTASIIAVVYLTKYLIVMPYATVSDITWGHIMPYLLNQNILDDILTTRGTKLFVTFMVDGMMFIANGIWGVLCMYFMLYIFEKAYTHKRDILEKNDALFLCAPCITSTAICLALLIIIRQDTSKGNILFYNDIPYMRLVIVIICCLMILTIYSAIVVFQQQLARREDIRITALQEAHIRQLSSEINNLNGFYSELRSLRHDMNNHIENLSALFLSNAPTHEIKDYIDRMRDTADTITLSYSTGNPVSDIILHRKKTAADAEEILFECDFVFPEGSNLDAYDVGVILDNALDNALTAVSNASPDTHHLFISIRSYRKGHLYFIEVKNPFSQEIIIDPKTNLPATSKSDTAHHGLGLAAICRIAEKYHGSAQADISSEDSYNYFTLTVMMRLN